MFTIPLYNVVTCEYNKFYVLFTRTYVTSVLQSSSIQNMTFIETATLHSSLSYIITHKRHDELIIFHIFQIISRVHQFGWFLVNESAQMSCSRIQKSLS